MSNVYDTFKTKIFGLKKKVRFLRDDEIIQDGDFMTVVYDGWYKSVPVEEKEQVMKEYITKNINRRLVQTMAIGDLVSEHPSRLYLRVV